MSVRESYEQFVTDLRESLAEGYADESRVFKVPLTLGGDWEPGRLHLSDTSAVIQDEGCPRQLWLRLSGAERKARSLGTLRMFDAGHANEAVWFARAQPGMEQRGWALQRLERVAVDGVDGTLDGVFYGDDLTVVVDAKTVRSGWYKVQERMHGKDPDAWPCYPSQVLQVRSYCLAVDADFGVLWRGDRDGSNPWLYTLVERDDEAVQAAIAGLKLIEAMEGAEESPKIRRGSNGKLPWQCNYCDYFGTACGGAD